MRHFYTIIIALFFFVGTAYAQSALDTLSDDNYVWPVNTFDVDTTGPHMSKGIVMRVWYGEIPVCVYAPPKYWNQSFYDQPFNILYLLSGTGDSDMAWVLDGGASEILDEMYQDNEIEQMVVVMPLVSSGMDGKYEEMFYDFMHAMESHLFAGRTKGRRAIAGLSIGGFHAMHISHYYPNMFDYVGIFSGIYTPHKMEIFNKNVKELFPTDESVPEPYRHVEVEMARQFQDPPSLYYIAVGKGDFLHRQNDLLREYMDEHGYKYRYHESTGGHDWRNWREYLTLFLPKLFRNNEQ